MLSTTYSPKCASFRSTACMARSSMGSRPGKRVASNGRMSALVRSLENQPVESVQISAAQVSAGSHRARPSLRKLGDGAVDDLEQLLAELGVDEALDLLALRGVAAAACLAGELGAGDHVEKGEHPGAGVGVSARQLPVERESERQVAEAILGIFGEFHRASVYCSAQLAPSPRCV